MTKFGNNYVFNRAVDLPYESNNTANMKGVGLKTILLLVITLITGLIGMSFIRVNNVTENIVLIGYTISPIIVFILSLVMSFSPKTAKILAIPYAIAEGLGISGLAALLFYFLGVSEAGAILGLALLITVAIFLGGAILYTSGLFKVNGKFKKIMYVILLGIVICTLVFGIISIFLPDIYLMFFGNNNLSLGISIIMVIISSIYTVISLDNANEIVQTGLDKNYEWYAAFGIVLNIIWLFYEVVRLLLIILSKTRDS